MKKFAWEFARGRKTQPVFRAVLLQNGLLTGEQAAQLLEEKQRVLGDDDDGIGSSTTSVVQDERSTNSHQEGEGTPITSTYGVVPTGGYGALGTGVSSTRLRNGARSRGDTRDLLEEDVS